MQAQGEHTDARQVVLWLGFKPMTLVLLSRSANHVVIVLPNPLK